MDIGKLQASIELHEGLLLKPYTDTTGNVTIGYGRNLTEKGINATEAQILLNNDISDVLAEATKQDWWDNVSGNDARARACAEILFNIGLGGFNGFKTAIGCLLDNDFAGAGAAFLDSLWARQVGQRAEVLAAMIVTGTDPGA